MRGDVLVVVGGGELGAAIASRIGSGSTVLMASRNEHHCQRLAADLRGTDIEVRTHPVDVTSPTSVAELAAHAAGLGDVRRVVHTAGLSPAHASVHNILQVNLAGVATVLEQFGPVMAAGGCGVVLASTGGYFAAPLSAAEEHALAWTPACELLNLPCAAPARFENSGDAYNFTKRAAQLRVRAASIDWARQDARINSISPGVVTNTMGAAELAGPWGPVIHAMLQGSATRRPATVPDVAAAAGFLLGPDSSYITGTDLLVDGGVTAAITTGHLDLSAVLS